MNFKLILGPKMGPKMGHFGGAPAQAQEAGAILNALVFKMAPRWPQVPQDNLLGAFLGL